MASCSQDMEVFCERAAAAAAAPDGVDWVYDSDDV